MECIEVSLQEVMGFRELKAEIQRNMMEKTTQGVVVSLGMNIPGPIKSGPSIYEAFREGKINLERLIESQKGTILQTVVLEEHAGYTVIYLIEGIRGLDLKRECVHLEENHMLGRIFDIDVTDEEFGAISREMTGAERRKCLLCSQDAKVCGRNRTHTVEQVQEKVTEIIQKWEESRYEKSNTSI
ncbi:MAG: citrate lyase holo-[acyl-carrier protein] synthase [Dorea sp.]